MTTPPFQPRNQPSQPGQNPEGQAGANPVPGDSGGLWAGSGGPVPQPGQPYGGQFGAVPDQPFGHNDGQSLASGSFGQGNVGGQGGDWPVPGASGGSGQTSAASPGYYLASDGQYYPVADQPGPGLPGVRQPKRKKRKALVAAAVAGALVVAAGGAFALLKLRGVGGAGSPEEAVEGLLADLSSLDLAKVAARMAPSEAVLFQPLLEASNAEDAQSDQTRAVKQAWDDMAAAVTIEFKDLEFSSDAIVEGVDRTAITGGEIRLDADTGKLTDAVM
ncbi:MAG: hypothetical protein LBU05_04685, partial [Bifidobacteriaceae bacterium]|nr:hypothetical protein [Bifidobacteriaceae bacterium]